MPVPDKVAIFWDYENCCPPATQGLGYDVVNNIGRMARVFGCVVTFKAYLDISAQQTLKATTFRSELQLSGVSIIDCPHIGRKEVVDKMIMVDMLTFAMDHPPPATVFLITSDRDYAYAVSTLRLRKYRVILITPKVTACLEAQASAVVDWSVALTRSRIEPQSDSSVRRPYNDLDADLFTELLREISQLGEDDLTVCSAPPLAEGTSKARRISTDLPHRPPFAKGDGVDNTNITCECRHNQALPEVPDKSSNVSEDPLVSVTSALKASESRRPSVSTPVLPRARSATIHSVTVPKPDKEPVQRHTGSLPAPSNISLDIQDSAGSSALPDSADRHTSDAGNDGLSDDDGSPSSIVIGSPANPAPTNSFIHSPLPLLNPRLNLTSTIPTPSSKTRTISGGTPVSFGDPIPKTSTAVKPVDTPRLGRKASPPPTLNPFSNGFIPNTDAELMEALGLSDGDHESPPPFQSNLGTTLHDNGRNILPVPVNGDSNVPASAVNAMNCPNLVPPTELPLDEQSSPAASSEGAQLDPEGSSSDVVSTCTSQTSDLSSGSPASAGAAAQLPPNLATRQQIRAKFLPLIQRLLADRSSGMIRSSRSDVAMAVVKADKDAYQRAGTASFRQYSILAQQFGLVVLGGNSANSWIALHPAWFDETMESGLPLGAVKIGSSTTDGQQTKFPTDVGAGCFQPLVDALVRMHRSGFRRPLRSLVGQMLPPRVYQDARVAGFEDYVARATEIHIVQCGGDGSSAWISLHPDIRV
ncbi:NYN domain-containing protein [Scleroderma yunnanense]